MTADSSYSVNVIMKNTGTSAWTDAGLFHLASQNPQDNIVCKVGRTYLGSTGSVNPGQTKTFIFTVTAPATPGTYNFQWWMVKELVERFGDFTTNVSVSVVSQSSIKKGNRVT